MSELSDDLLAVGVASWLVASIDRLARKRPDGMSPYLVAVGPDIGLSGSQATCRCRFVMRDPQGLRVSQLIEHLATQIVDFCIPRSRINEAVAHFEQHHTTTKILQLQHEAQDLFTKLKTSGEGGELLLYALLETELGLPQLLCKMPLKTDSQMHVHGTDGIHAKGLPNGRLALYWAESKLYGTVNQAIDAAFKDLAPYLLGIDDSTE